MSLKYIDRRGTNSVKWDGPMLDQDRDDLLCMWVADMDFDLAEPVKAALTDYVQNVPLGYYRAPESLYEAFMSWEKKYHGYDIKREWICTSPGVVAAFYWVLLMSTRPGDGVIILTPCYYPMLNAVQDNDRRLVMCDLEQENGKYVINYENFENDIIDNNVRLFILSSPHNPVGKIYTREELQRLMDICRRHGVLVISDEIHQDFEWAGNRHVPTATVGDYDDILITMTSLSKTFNLAACSLSFVIIPDEKLRARYKDFTKRIAVSEPNAFGCVAFEAALNEGRPWFEECRFQIYDNYKYVRDTFEFKLPQVKVAELQGTYLCWIDLSAYCKTQEETEELMARCGLAVDFGSWFGGERFCGFIRLNLATSYENIASAVLSIIGNLKDREAE